MTDGLAVAFIEGVADRLWDQLAKAALLDDRGSAEYERRIVGLRAWLRDEDGQPPERDPRMCPPPGYGHWEDDGMARCTSCGQGESVHHTSDEWASGKFGPL